MPCCRAFEFETIKGIGPELCGLPRIPVPRTWVNKAKKKDRSVVSAPVLPSVEEKGLLLGDRAPHQGNRPDPADHQCQGGGQGHPSAHTTALRELLHRSARRGTCRGSGRRAVWLAPLGKV